MNLDFIWLTGASLMVLGVSIFGFIWLKVEKRGTNGTGPGGSKCDCTCHKNWIGGPK